MLLIGGYFELKVPSGSEEGVGNSLRPFHRKAPWRREKVLDHQGIQITAICKAISIEVNQLALTLINRVEIEGGTGYGLLNLPSSGQTPNKGRLSCTELAVKRQNSVFRNVSRELACDLFGRFGRFGFNPDLKLLEQTHNWEKC